MVRTLVLDESDAKNLEHALNHESLLEQSHQFVEALMGWPIGVTVFESLGMESCQWLQRWRSYISEIV